MVSDACNGFYRKNAYVVPGFLSKISTCSVDELPGNVALGDFIKKQHDISHVTVRDISFVRNEQQVLKRMILDMSKQLTDLSKQIERINDNTLGIASEKGSDIVVNEGIHTMLTFKTLYRKNNEKKHVSEKILHFWEFDLQQAYDDEKKKEIISGRKTWMCNLKKCADHVQRMLGRSPECQTYVPGRDESVKIKQAWRIEQKKNIDEVLSVIRKEISVEGKKTTNLTVTSMCRYIRTNNGANKRQRTK